MARDVPNVQPLYCPARYQERGEYSRTHYNTTKKAAHLCKFICTTHSGLRPRCEGFWFIITPRERSNDNFTNGVSPMCCGCFIVRCADGQHQSHNRLSCLYREGNRRLQPVPPYFTEAHLDISRSWQLWAKLCMQDAGGIRPADVCHLRVGKKSVIRFLLLHVLSCSSCVDHQAHHCS
jgi:hypothetical protein